MLYYRSCIVHDTMCTLYMTAKKNLHRSTLLHTAAAVAAAGPGNGGDAGRDRSSVSGCTGDMGDKRPWRQCSL